MRASFLSSGTSRIRAAILAFAASGAGCGLVLGVNDLDAPGDVGASPDGAAGTDSATDATGLSDVGPGPDSSAAADAADGAPGPDSATDAQSPVDASDAAVDADGASGPDGATGPDASDAGDARDASDASDATDALCVGDASDAAVYLIAGQSPTGAITTDGTDLFWLDHPSGAGATSVRACAATGCNGTPRVLTSVANSATAIAVTATDVFVAGDSLYRCALGGCASASPVATIPNGQKSLATDGTRAFFASGTAGKVTACVDAVCSFTADLAGAEPGVFGIAADDTNVYWLANGMVRFCAKGGCGGTPGTLAAGQSFPANTWALAVDATTVYWGSQETSTWAVRACAKGGCGLSPRTVVGGLPWYASGLAPSVGTVYFDLGPTGLASCPTGGCVTFASLAPIASGGPVVARGPGCRDGLVWVTFEAPYVGSIHLLSL